MSSTRVIHANIPSGLLQNSICEHNSGHMTRELVNSLIWTFQGFTLKTAGGTTHLRIKRVKSRVIRMQYFNCEQALIM
jgi:hypothetical protein